MTRGLDPLEADSLIVVVLVDCFAKELVVIEDADLGDVAGVIADDDRPSYVPGQGR